MKILFITNSKQPDFQHDGVFYALRKQFGSDCVDTKKIWYMYREDKNLLWNKVISNNGKDCGRGFTLCGLLDNCEVDRTNIEEKIKNKFYDKIVYGSIHRCSDYASLVASVYSPKDVIFIDGEDSDKINFFFNFGIYYKRELTIEPTKSILPISFCIPDLYVLSKTPEKTKMLGHVIPGDVSTYIFDNQEDYYKDYQNSYVGITFKKGGWDCLRHYEILANGCLPYFPLLEECPKYTMVNFPKDIIIKNHNWIVGSQIIPNDYNDIVLELLNYTKRHLTEKALLNYLIQ